MSEPITIQTQLSEELKNQATDILNQLGLNFTTYINMALNQLVIKEGIPFEVTLNPRPEEKRESGRELKVTFDSSGMSLTTEEKMLLQEHRRVLEEMGNRKDVPKKTVDRILELMESYPHITARELAVQVGTSMSGVHYHIKHLKAAGKIERIGADNGGSWKVNRSQTK